MLGFFADYGFFLAQCLTILILFALAVMIVAAAARRGSHTPQGLNVEHVNKEFEESEEKVRQAVLPKSLFKKEAKEKKKAEKKREKARGRETDHKPRLFLIDFKGDIRASATESLREEVNAVLSIATPSDRVLVRLENPGGLVHEHGLAASQLVRLKQHNVPLVVAVDKVAASGGYLMACVADRIIAAPFAIIGSIGVIAQLPNFHRWLESKGIDFEQVTAGRFKRTLTMFGENTPEGREKLKAELEDVHDLFKGQVAAHRPDLDVDGVATGEHWYAIKALELGLVDEIRTSDDFLLEAVKTCEVYRICFKRRKPMPDRIFGGAENLLSKLRPGAGPVRPDI